MGIGTVAGAATLGGVARSAQADDGTSTSGSAHGSAASSDALVFDKDDYTTLTATISTDDGDKEVKYRFYKAVTYVANPVDEAYQSLTVSVPVEIDGKAVDASDAPILFANSIAGFMPVSVQTATSVNAMGGGGGQGGGTWPSASASASASASGGTGGSASGGGESAQANTNLPELGLAAGYVVVQPGCRGRTLVNSEGVYYGTAPAVIVDLKAAVRYLRFNKDRIPGDTERIISTGGSAGGEVSALLGASGDSRLYDSYLKELGAADASDAIFATGAWCAIVDLENADGAYEWNWGSLTAVSTGETVDAADSKELTNQFVDYQASLHLKGLNGFGPLTARNYDRYLLETYLQPAAATYLKGLSAADRTAYLAGNTFITWKNGRATFTWDDYLAHVGTRQKNLPAFDGFDLSVSISALDTNNEFGLGTTAGRHFTEYSQKRDASGTAGKRLDSDIPEKLRLMNPMYHLRKGNPGRSKHWWIRLGTIDTYTSLTVSANLTATVDGLGDNVSHLMYWDQGHMSDLDPGDFIKWIAKVTGYRG
ncbi:subtype B tannase [Streptomyces maremycinicus]|uniref:subtype B tannase n=1 Tax=Streptomyces maremycinicus TaxID=1679753 RepID=UPI000788E2A7|nr:subtype B tannase [Streptomyces sp. NBRC 110468]